VGTEPSQVEVIVGRTQLSTAQQGQTVGVRAIVSHPKFRETFVHDVALLQLERPITDITPIQRVAVNQKLEDTVPKVLAIGWGNTARSPQPDVRPDRLQRARMKRMKDELCTSINPALNLQTSFCIGAEGLIPDEGDSGGPVFIKRAGGSFLQLGVVSQSIVIVRLSNPEVADFISKTLANAP